MSLSVKASIDHIENLLFLNKQSRYRNSVINLLDHFVQFVTFKSDPCQLTKARFLQGFCHEFGRGGVLVNYSKAVKFYDLAAKKGHVVALTRLAFLRKNGRPGVVKDNTKVSQHLYAIYKERFKSRKVNSTSVHDKNPRIIRTGTLATLDPLAWLWWCATQVEDPDALYCLGCCFHHGYGTRESPSRALDMYKKSAQSKRPWALSILGYCYGEGYGTQIDVDKSFNYYTQASNLGNAVAMYNLAYCYETGLGTSKNLSKAFEWYLKSALRGSGLGAAEVGYMYEYGQGTEKDMVQALRWHKFAAKMGEPSGLLNLARYYLRDDDDRVPSDDDRLKAFNLFKRSADNGSAGAMFEVGLCYETGIGCDICMEKAFTWYSLALENGNTDAYMSLARFYEWGLVVKQDIVTALAMLDMYFKERSMTDILEAWYLSLARRVDFLHHTKTTNPLDCCASVCA